MWTRIPSSSLRVTGQDRADFVQGQMTGDIRGQGVPGMVACAFLNVRGQTEHFARVYKRESDIYLHLDADQAPALAARLKRYIIFDQVEVQDTSNTLRTVHVWDAEHLPGWQSSGPDTQAFEWAGTQVLGGRVNRTGTPGVDLHYLAASENEVLAQLEQEVPLEQLDTARIGAGIPDMVRDGFTGTLLQEIGLDIGGPLPAISYRKGCYVGQEIMARLEARGNARYHLVRLRGEHLPAHAEIKHGGKVAGQSGLSAGGACLARLRKEIAPGSAVQVAGAPATVELLSPHA